MLINDIRNVCICYFLRWNWRVWCHGWPGTGQLSSIQTICCRFLHGSQYSPQVPWWKERKRAEVCCGCVLLSRLWCWGVSSCNTTNSFIPIDGVLLQKIVIHSCGWTYHTSLLLFPYKISWFSLINIPYKSVVTSQTPVCPPVILANPNVIVQVFAKKIHLSVLMSVSWKTMEVWH